MQLALLHPGELGPVGIVLILILLGASGLVYRFVGPRLRSFRPNLKKHW
jgi:hypothetical protein